MNAKVKITVRDTAGNTVALVVRGHANEHAASLIEKASTEALRQLSALRTSPAK